MSIPNSIIKEILDRWSKVRVAIKPDFSLQQAKDDIFTLLVKIDECDTEIGTLKDRILQRKNNEVCVALEIKAIFKKYDI